MARVLVVDSDTAELNARRRARAGDTTGDGYASALTQLDATCQTEIICPYEGDATPDLRHFDGVAFTGSGVEWNTDDPRAEPLAEVMRATFAAGIPSFGSCNGMQLAASVLGGASEASPNGREDGLALDVRLTEAGRQHPMMAGRRDGFAVPCVHRDEITRLPEGAVVLAGNTHTPVQAICIEREGFRFWGVQYHPEYSLPFIGRGVRDWNRWPADKAADLEIAHQDAAAARRLGARFEDLQTPARISELRNWLSSL